MEERSPAVGQDVHVSLLGGFELRNQGKLVSLPLPAERLLAFLALRERPTLRSYAAATLWPESTEAHARGNLRSALWRLTHCGCTVVQLRGAHLQLAPRADVDVRIGRDLAGQLNSGSPPPGADLVWETLASDILPDWYEEWVIAEREVFCQLRVHALETVCELLIGVGRYDQAVQAGLVAVVADPLRESAQRALIKAYLAEGNSGPAVRQFEVFRKLLHEEFGIEPSRGLKGLVDALRLTAR